jgi:Core-2/I-Branching enzyme
MNSVGTQGGQLRIAYIVAAHRLMGQVTRMIRALSAPGDAFFVHVDQRTDHREGRNVLSDLMRSLESSADVRPIKRHRVDWGHWTQVHATVECIKAVIDSGITYDRVVFLSGQDYPIKSRSYIKSFFARHRDKEFMESFSLMSPNRWTDWGKWYSATSRAWYLHLGIRSHWLHIPIRRKIPLGLVPHGGSNWWCLGRPAVEYIHQFLLSHPEVSSYFRRTFLPDEMFFQTILSNSPLASRITGDNLTHIDSSRPTPPWPAVMDTSDFPTLMASPKLFARKFDVGHDAEILDLLDEALLSKSAAEQSHSAHSHVSS